MKVSNLTLNESAGNGGFTHRIEITHADLTTTATNTAQVIQMLNLPIGAVILNVAAKLVIPFQDASDAAFNTNTITIGDGNATSRFLASTEINENGSEIDFAIGTAAAATVGSDIGAASAQTAATVATANASGDTGSGALANQLKVDFNKTITDVANILTELGTIRTFVNALKADAAARRGAPLAYLVADTLDITVNSMSAKALSDIDTGELHVFVTVAELNTLSQAIVD